MWRWDYPVSRASPGLHMQWFYEAASKVRETKNLGFINQNTHTCLLSKSCLTGKSRPLFATYPHSSASCDIPIREFSLGIPGFPQDYTNYPSWIKDSPASGCQPAASFLENSRDKRVIWWKLAWSGCGHDVPQTPVPCQHHDITMV